MADGFDSDFAKGEREAARLVSRMEQALKRAEEFERQAARERQLARRSGRGGEPGSGEAGTSDRVSRRLDDEKAITNQSRERERLIQRETQALSAQERMIRRIRAVGPAAFTEATLAGPGSVPPNRRLPPGPPGGYYEYPGQRQLPPGPPPPLQLGPGARPPLGLPSPGETVGGSRYLEEEAKQAASASRGYDQYQRSQRAAADSNVRFGRSLGENLFIQQQANTQFSRYGALSTEWIAATARGSTTIQELGRQTTATIGKFGGWLAAGSLLYTALGAVQAIGHGAIESASGVNQLQRVINNVDPGTAQAGFRQYSQQFNLPIGDVASAAYEMGKIFHDQNEALEASKAVLYSVKVGELDTATASRYLIAIINGFHLPASQMVTVFDQLNGAQNKFGISINDVEAGLAKASGAFNAATTKGSPLEKYHELLALITTAQKATGQTGQVVGTAIQRAPNFLKQANNQAVLKKYGIDAGGDLNQIINEAFKVAQGLSGHQIGELASAIFGPQYGARIGTPLLQQYDLYKKVFAGTSKEKTRNSGQRELNTLLASMSEELSRVITQIEIIGSGLAQAGFLDIFGESVIVLNQLLSGVNDLLELFNKLPAPLTHTLAIMLELYGVVAVLRKFNLGDSFAAGSLGRRVLSGPNRDKRLLDESYTGQVGFLTQERDRSATQASRATTGVRVANARVLQEEEKLAALKVSQGATAEAVLAQERNIVRAETQRNAAMERKLAAELAEEELLLTQIAVEDKKAALVAARNDAEARVLAARYGDIVPTSFDQGAAVSGRQAAEARGYAVVTNPDGSYGLSRSGAGPSAAAGAAVAAEADRSARAAQSGLRGAGGAWRNLALTEISLAQPGASYRDAVGRAGTALSASSKTVSSAVLGVSRLGPALATAGARMASLGRGFYGLIGGPLGALLIGSYLAIEYGDDLGRALAGGQNVIDKMNSFETEHVTTGAQNKGFLHQYERLAEEAGLSLKQLQTQLPTLHLDGLPEYFDAEEAYLQQLESRNQKIAHRQGRAGKNLFPDQLRNQVQGLSDYQAGTGKFNQEFRRVQEELRYANSASDPKELKSVKRELELVGAKALNSSTQVTGFFSQFQALADKLLEKQIKNLSSLVQGGPTFGSRKDVGALVRASLVRGIRDLQSPKASVQAKGAQTLTELPDALEAYGQEELKTSLDLARTQDQRYAAYQRYISLLRGSAKQLQHSFGSNRQHLTNQLQKTEEDLRKAYAEGKGRQQSDYTGGPSFGVEPSRGPDPVIARLKERAAALRKAIGNLSKTQKYELRQIRALIAAQERERLQEEVSAIQETSQIKSARIGDTDPVGQAQVGLRAAERVLSLVRSKSGTPQEVRQALLAVLNARQELTDAVRQEASELADATQQLAKAKAQGDPIAQAQADIARAQAQLSAARTVAERRSALAELIEAQNNLDKAYAEIALARLALKAAQTDDPIAQARIKLREAEVQLKYAKGPLERLEGQAAKQQAIRDKRDAVAQTRIEDIQFQADIGKISHEQEIAAYERLLHTLTLSRDTRRELRRKLHDLRAEDAETGDFELTVGDIQLPTIYDIRRAIGGSAGPNRSQYNDQSTTTVHITVNGGERNALFREVDNALNRGNKSARRSAGHIPTR